MSLARTGRRVLIAVVCGALTTAAGADAPVLPSELARNITGLDGQRVTVAGTLGRVRTHISKKGERSYSFPVSDEHAAVAVLTPTPPACRQGARVIAQGIVDGRARRLDARTVACP